MRISDNELLNHCSHDIRYQDVTTMLQEDIEKQAHLVIYARHPLCVCCSEEAARIAVLHNCELILYKPSGCDCGEQEDLLHIQGSYRILHAIWRSMQNLLEYGSAIASYTAEMKKVIIKYNPNCQLLATRKTIPFAKQMCVKAVHSGGGQMHRLGLDDSVLFFTNHRILYKSNADFYEKINSFKTKMPEKKIIIETKSVEDAKALLDYGADGIQTDKMKPVELDEIIRFRNLKHPRKIVLAAGGINHTNVDQYAKTGVNGVVTSSMYTQKLADMGCRIEML